MGYQVDFEHPQQQKVLEHYLVFGILGPLALLTLVQRFYTKVCLSDGLKVDDCKSSYIPPDRFETDLGGFKF
ncbi:integral membrane protein [Colletotrichum tofieldiae]|nr:integral membrane protein [Colletotrichum tofieldiae]